MREYQIEEVMKMLRKNPKLEFESKTANRIKVIYCNEGYIFFKVYLEGESYPIKEEKGGGKFNGNVEINTKWTLVRQPVTWQEAIQARLDGKNTACENCKGCADADICVYAEKQKFLSRGSKVIGACEGQLRTGTWYIEDDANE